MSLDRAQQNTFTQETSPEWRLASHRCADALNQFCFFKPIGSEGYRDRSLVLVKIWSSKNGILVLVVCNVSVFVLSLWSWYSAFRLGLDLQLKLLIASGVFLVLYILDCTVQEQSTITSAAQVPIYRAYIEAKNISMIYFLFFRLTRRESNTETILHRLNQNIHHMGQNIQNADMTICQR